MDTHNDEALREQFEKKAFEAAADRLYEMIPLGMLSKGDMAVALHLRECVKAAIASLPRMTEEEFMAAIADHYKSQGWSVHRLAVSDMQRTYRTLAAKFPHIIQE